MELQVQELLDRIKADGVDAAKAEAAEIKRKAEAEAGALLEAAEAKAASREAEAEARAAALEKASALALTQASRDAILSLRQKVQAFMEEVVRDEAAKVFDADFLTSYLPELLKAMGTDSGSDLTIFVPEKRLADLDAALAARLSKELGRGIEFRPFPGLDAGFRFSFKDSALQYDFSAQALAAILAARVGELLASSLRKAAEQLE